MRRGTQITEAGLQDVARRIQRRIRDTELARRLMEKVKTYLKTKNDRDDLTLQESGAIYRDEDYGETVPLSKKRDLDIDWSNHAEYRSDLRDIDPDEVNDNIADWLKERLRKKGPDSKKVRMKLPSGTAVVDYDLTEKPADADVITVWGADKAAGKWDTPALRGALREYARNFEDRNERLPDSKQLSRFGIEWWDANGMEGNPANRLRRIIRELRSEGLVASKPRVAGMDLQFATPAEVTKIAEVLAADNFSPHDAAYASYCLNAIDRDWKAVTERLKDKCLSIYRSNLLKWFRYALINRANIVHFAGLNKALSRFVREMPSAILGNGKPDIPKFKASWAFLNADRLEQAGAKVVKIIKKEAMEAGLWKGEEAESEYKPPLYYDSKERFWYIPYSQWTYQNRQLLGQMGFRLGRRIWYVEDVTPRIKSTFDIGGHGSDARRVPLEPPTLRELDDWYYKTWLPKNIHRYQNLFENYIREAGSRITLSFSVNRSGKVNCALTRGVKKTSDAIEELRLRYLGRQGRGPWLEVMDRFLELQGTRGDNALHVIDRMNNLEHSNGMFMERFPSKVQSWYLKFLNAKFSSPRVTDLAKYINDSDLREFIIFVSGDKWKVERYDEPDYRDIEKEGPPEDEQEPDWLALGYPYEKGFTKPMRDDPEVQKNLEELRELERYNEDPEAQREIREWLEKHPLRYSSMNASNLGPATFAGLIDSVSGKVRLSTDSDRLANIAERIAVDTVAKKNKSKKKDDSLQKKRMPTDRNLGTRVHPDKTKFQKRDRSKKKQELRDRY